MCELRKRESTVALWFVTPCSLVSGYQRFRGTNLIHHQGEDTVARKGGMAGEAEVWKGCEISRTERRERDKCTKGSGERMKGVDY
jgi:hypothetical protein